MDRRLAVGDVRSRYMSVTVHGVPSGGHAGAMLTYTACQVEAFCRRSPQLNAAFHVPAAYGLNWTERQEGSSQERQGTVQLHIKDM